MTLDEGGGEEFGSFCGCEGREAWFYCEVCTEIDEDDLDNAGAVKQLTYRDPSCSLSEAEHV